MVKLIVTLGKLHVHFDIGNNLDITLEDIIKTETIKKIIEIDRHAYHSDVYLRFLKCSEHGNFLLTHSSCNPDNMYWYNKTTIRQCMEYCKLPTNAEYFYMPAIFSKIKSQL